MFYFAFLLDWKIITDPKTAADVFRKQLLITEEQEQPLRFSLDLREDLDEQDREIISDISDQMSTGLGHSPVCSEVGPTILFLFFLL